MRVVFLHLFASVILIIIVLQNENERFDFMPEKRLYFHAEQEVFNWNDELKAHFCLV